MAAFEELLGELHSAVADDLLQRIRAGGATHQELGAAIKFLKDNGIEALPAENNPLQKLADNLPDFSEDDGLHARH